MIDTRLPVLGAIAVMLLNCGVAFAEPNQPSADYIMPGCRGCGLTNKFFQHCRVQR